MTARRAKKAKRPATQRPAARLVVVERQLAAMKIRAEAAEATLDAIRELAFCMNCDAMVEDLL